MRKFRATRYHNGKLVITHDTCAQYEHIIRNFKVAARRWGYLVDTGESINAVEWVNRIRAADPDCLQSGDCIDAIQSIMHDNTDTVPVCFHLREPQQHWWQRFFLPN